MLRSSSHCRTASASFSVNMNELQSRQIQQKRSDRCRCFLHMQPDGVAPAMEGPSIASRTPGGSTASTARETRLDATASAARTASTSRGQHGAAQRVAVTLLVRRDL